MATGTDDDQPQVRIVPVRTGFEGASKLDRSDFESTFRPVDSGELADLFVTPDSFDVDDGDGQDMEDLFVVESSDREESDEDLDDLL